MTSEQDIFNMTRDLESLRIGEEGEDIEAEATRTDFNVDTGDEVEDDFEDWDEFNRDLPSLTAPKCRGLFLTDDDKVIPFVGTDPDAKVNVWTYDP
eukprot:6485065-Ditylum_brightwellii.AAC.1